MIKKCRRKPTTRGRAVWLATLLLCFLGGSASASPAWLPVQDVDMYVNGQLTMPGDQVTVGAPDVQFEAQIWYNAPDGRRSITTTTTETNW